MCLSDRHRALPESAQHTRYVGRQLPKEDTDEGGLSALYSSAGTDVLGAGLSINDESSLTAA